MPGSRLVVFPGAGHFPHHHDPERFVSVVRDFLADTRPHEYDPAVWRALLRTGRPIAGSDPMIGVEPEELVRAYKPSGT
jgi:hypothetical protein